MFGGKGIPRKLGWSVKQQSEESSLVQILSLAEIGESVGYAI